MKRRGPILGCVAVVSLLVVGCGGPLDEVRARLPESQRPLFDAGAAAATSCWSCHDLLRPVNKTGPHLVGVMGRPAASVPGFHYSEAMRASGLRWEEGALRAYLANPQGTVPGTSMVAPGIRDPERLRALLFFLQHATRPQPDE